MPKYGNGQQKAVKKRGRKKNIVIGEGMWDDIGSFVSKTVDKIKNDDTVKKAVGTVKDAADNVGNYADAVVNGRNDYQPKVRNIISKYGRNTITGITIGRKPVSSALTSALSAASFGQFGKNLQDSPYDTLFHLFLMCKLDDGTTIINEKNEVINMDINPSMPAKSETKVISNIPSGLTLQEMMDKTKAYMGGEIFTYSAKNNNCQDYALAVLKANKIGDESDYAFVKQNTAELFKNLSSLRKISNTVTDLGAKINVITTGAGIKKKLSNNNIKNMSDAIHHHHYHHHHIVGTGTPIMDQEFTGNDVAHFLGQKESSAPIMDQNMSGNRIHEAAKDVKNFFGLGVKKTRGRPKKSVVQYARGGDIWGDIANTNASYIPSELKQHIRGGDIWGDIANVFERDVPSALIHQGIPMFTEQLGSMVGAPLGIVGSFGGKQFGKHAGTQLADHIGKKTGYGIQHHQSKYRKGSQEAKAHMAKLRAMRKK